MLDNDDGDSGQLAIATSCKAPKIIIKDRDDSHRCCQFAERGNRKFELWTSQLEKSLSDRRQKSSDWADNELSNAPSLTNLVHGFQLKRVDIFPTLSSYNQLFRFGWAIFLFRQVGHMARWSKPNIAHRKNHLKILQSLSF